MLIKFTYVDALTGVSMLDAPCANGPVLPRVPGIAIEFSNESEWPCDVPIFFGHCSAGSDPTSPGVIDVLTQEIFDTSRSAEMGRRAANEAAALQVRRAAMSCTPWQIRKAMTSMGIRADVESAVNSAGQEVQDAYAFALEFKRLDQFALGIAAKLEKSDAFMDELFELGMSL